jgi:hypothetical protein
MDERDYIALNKTLNKNVNYYGVELTAIESYEFSLFLNNPENPRMNTLTKNERLLFTKNWLFEQLNKKIL